MRAPVFVAACLLCVLDVLGCSGRDAPVVAPVERAPPTLASAAVIGAASASRPDVVLTPPAMETEPALPPVACAAGMQLVDTTYCPHPRLRCLKSEYNAPNHITICHAFAPGQTCAAGTERHERFCIDTYEYPNEEGAHPPVMVSAYDAEAACASKGKRLCWQSEWESACEGPDKLPFPYGLRRDPSKCNIDNPFVKPDLKRVYSSKPEVFGPELLKLDQSVASGAKAGCVSGFGVHDLTGNMDEWVLSEEHRGRSGWAGLKGGAWGHVRSACRPMTTSHPPEFTYYFISFRCCSDANLDGEPRRGAPQTPPGSLGAPVWRPPAVALHPHTGAPNAGWTTHERGPNRP